MPGTIPTCRKVLGMRENIHCTCKACYFLGKRNEVGKWLCLNAARERWAKKELGGKILQKPLQTQ